VGQHLCLGLRGDVKLCLREALDESDHNVDKLKLKLLSKSRTYL
jgi:hypothetical protein